MKDETVYTDLIQLTLSGNKEAYSELYDKTIQEVYKTAYFLIDDKLEAYMRFNAKLSEAKDGMGAKEYEEFTKELKKLTNAKLEYGDSNGNIDYDQLSPEKREEMKKISMGLQPYFDKLNGHKSSKEVLTQEEFDRYMEALMTHEIVRVKTKSTGGMKVEEVPEAYKDSFIKAEQFMEYVDEKVR
ncbi:DUF3600 domain-containing protein [Bacillus toyonensis]|uniref:Anti-sigma factor n=1 Tax=Bacillus toyonensis TaxID=155322 RepID=A0A2C4Q1A5_9BACI|nr:DUF3600 domain-containing protein [Bacillus toyonensis]PGB01531.1 anti-sigma factor [Bacillus toyonensis]PHD58321.1 anti-sigma factor [Bacillus toyonensis]